MNKKFKLFSTIASLCLAVALMAFGVWAASNPQFTVNSNVTFTASDDMFVGVKVTQVFGTSSVEKTAQSYEGSTYGNYTYKAPTEMAFDEVSFTTKNKELIYTVVITNYTADSAKVTVSLPAVLTVDVGSAVTSVETTLKTEGETANNALEAWDGTATNPTVTFKVTIKLLRTDISINDTDNVADFSFTVTRD